MKKNILLSVALFISVIVGAQTLQVPTELTQRQDSSYWGGNIPYNISQWLLASWISSNGTTNGTSQFTIQDSFNPSNTELNEIESNGGNIIGWPMYLRTADSTFFTDTVPYYLTGNVDKVLGRDSLYRKSWGEYYNEGHEIYHNSFNDQYIILATDDLGNIFDLETIIQLRNDYANINGYLTIKGLSEINQSNLTVRSEW